MLRAWVPGCSTGEEAYSLAIVLTEAAERLAGPRVSAQIFATDLDRDAVEQARQGVYPANIAADVSPERLRRFFAQEERGYRIRKEIRESVVFAPQNIVMDPPFTKLDILSCRNLLIYLSPELQKKLIPLFHYSLNPGGILFLGSAETVGTHSPLFGPLDAKNRLYRRLRAPRALRPSSSRPRSPPRRPRACPWTRSGPSSCAVRRRRTWRPWPTAHRPAPRPGRDPDQRQGRHPLHQRAHGEVPRAGGRQGEPQRVRHGA